MIAGQDKAEKVPVKKGLKLLLTNQLFLGCILLWMFQSVSFSVSGTILPYYCKYIFHNDTWLYSALYLTEILTLVVCIFLCAPLIVVRKAKHCSGWKYHCPGGHLFILPESLQHSMDGDELCCKSSRPCSLKCSCILGMIGDVVEFGTVEDTCTSGSLIFAGGSIGTKVGAGVWHLQLMTGLPFYGWIHQYGGGSVTQPDSALHMIVNIYKGGPLIVAGVCL